MNELNEVTSDLPPLPYTPPSHLVTPCTPGLLAVSIVTAAVQLTLLPEVDHVHQQLFAGAADKAGRVPQLVVAGAFCVHCRFAPLHNLLTVVAGLQKKTGSIQSTGSRSSQRNQRRIETDSAIISEI